MSTVINTGGTATDISVVSGGKVVQREQPLLSDAFTTNDAGPLTGERVCEPGPGRLTLVNTTSAGGAISIASNKLTFAHATSGQSYTAYGALIKGAIDRVPGLAMYGKFNLSRIAGLSFGFIVTYTLGNSSEQCFNFNGGSQFSVGDRAVTIIIGESLTANTDYQLAIILRANGAFYFVRGGAQYPSWTLVWLSLLDTITPLYAEISNFDSTNTLDDLTIKRLNSKWWDDYANATYFQQVVADGDTATADADGWLFVTWTPVASESLDIQVRRTDDNNCWIIRCAQSGTIKLYEKTAGVETERDSGKTQTWTAGTGYRIGIRFESSHIRSFVNGVAKHNYTSATFQQTSTGVKLAGGVAALANLELWPWAWGGTDLDTLAAPGATATTSPNPNRAIWITDIHISNTGGGLDPTTAQEGLGFAEHLNMMRPCGIINTGDNGENFGANSKDYRLFFHNLIRGPYRLIRGNHDEDEDYTVAVANSWTEFDGYFPAAAFPYHTVFDWPAAKVRFIMAHSYIIHSPSGDTGFATMDSSERTWIQGQIDSLSTGWKCIICTHFPADTYFGNEIKSTHGGTELLALLQTNIAKIVCYFHGHRHIAPEVHTLDNIKHFNGASGAYWTSWGAGGFMLMEYSTGANTITIQIREGRPPYNQLARSLWTPLVLAL